MTTRAAYPRSIILVVIVVSALLVDQVKQILVVICGYPLGVAQEMGVVSVDRYSRRCKKPVVWLPRCILGRWRARCLSESQVLKYRQFQPVRLIVAKIAPVFSVLGCYQVIGLATKRGTS